MADEQPETESNITGDAQQISHNKQETTSYTEFRRSFYEDTCYNRNNTLIAKYVNRVLDDYPTPTERYYDIRLVSAEGRTNYMGEVGDQCIMFHSNRICLVTIAPTHPVLAEDKTITKLDFSFENSDTSVDRLNLNVRGKRKNGAQKLKKNSPLCGITCSDGTKYILTPCIPCKLIEVNQRLLKEPQLIKSRPLESGFIAIVQPNDWKHMDQVRESLPKLGVPPSEPGTTGCC